MPGPVNTEALFAKGRLVAGAGDQQEPYGQLTATAPQPDTPLSTLGRLAQVTTSGQKFLGAISGGRLDISGLPGYLREPIDVLANPLSIGMIAAAPFTAGGSLAALGAQGTGRLVAGAAAQLLAGGLVAGVAGQFVAKHLPEETPDWVKFGLPLVAGIVAGGGAAREIGKRLPAVALKVPPAPRSIETIIPTEDPLQLPYMSPGKTKWDQIKDATKAVTRRGVISDAQTAPILGQGPLLLRQVQDERQVLFQMVKTEVDGHPEIKYITDPKTGGAAPYALATEVAPAAVEPGAAALLPLKAPTFGANGLNTEPVVLYHGTSQNAADAILQNGEITGGYATEQPTLARAFAAQTVGEPASAGTLENAAVLRIEMPPGTVARPYGGPSGGDGFEIVGKPARVTLAEQIPQGTRLQQTPEWAAHLQSMRAQNAADTAAQRAARFAAMSDADLQALNGQGTAGPINTNLTPEAKQGLRHMVLRTLPDADLASAMRNEPDPVRLLDLRAEAARRAGMLPSVAPTAAAGAVQPGEAILQQRLVKAQQALVRAMSSDATMEDLQNIRREYAEARAALANPDDVAAAAADKSVGGPVLSTDFKHLADIGFPARPLEQEAPPFGSWIISGGKEIAANDQIHEDLASEIGQTTNSLLEKGWVRRASSGAYTISNKPTPETVALLDMAIARDAPSIIQAARGSGKPPTVYVDGWGTSVDLSVYADQRAKQIAALMPKAQSAPEAPVATTPGWFPLVDIAEHPERYTASPALQQFVDRWSAQLTDYHNQYGKVLDKPLEVARDIGPDGKFLTRGRPIEDGTDGLVTPTGRPRSLAAIPGPEKNRVYTSVAEGVANGEKYPRFEEAVADYVQGVGNAIVGRHMLNQLKQLTDAEGNSLILDLNRSMPLRDAANEIIRDASGKPVMQSYTETVPRGFTSIPSIPGAAAEAQLAKSINSVLSPSGPIHAANVLAEAFNKPFRTLHVAFDMGDYIARIGPVAAVLHPLIFARTTGKGFAAIFNTSLVGKEYRAIEAELADAGMQVTVRDMAKNGLRFQNTDFAPGGLRNWPIISHLGGVYGNALDMMRARMAQAELMSKSKSGLNVLDPTIFRQITAGINLATGAAAGKPIANAAIFAQFPNWLQSQAELIITAASHGGLDGDYARKSLLGLLAIGTTAAVVGNKIGGHLESSDDIKDMFYSGVPTFWVGNQRINVFGPYSSLVRGVFAALKGDPSALIRGRASPLIQTGWDLALGQNFIGQPANFNDTDYWIRNLLPYSLSSLTQRGGVGGVLNALGVNATQETPLQELKKASEAEYGKKYEDFTGKEREAFRAQHPDLYEQLHSRTIQRAQAGDEFSRGVLESQTVTDNLLAKQVNLMSLLKSGQILPRDFRQALNDSSHDAALQKQQIRKDFQLDKFSKDPSPVQEALKSYYGLFESADIGVLNGGPKVGQINWDEFDRQYAELQKQLSPDQQKAISDRVTTHDPSLNWFYNNKEIINQSGYYDAADKAFKVVEKSVQRIAPTADSFGDLQRLQAEALAKGDKTLYVYTSALINRVNTLAENLKAQMRFKDKALTTALVQDGYLAQPRGLPLAARPQ